MTVKEANAYMGRIGNAIKDLQLLISDDDLISNIENISGVRNLLSTVDISVNAMISYKRVLKDRIDNAEI